MQDNYARSLINQMSLNQSEKENPFNDSYGQEIVSVQENFWARLAREGTTRTSLSENVAVSTTNTKTWMGSLATPLDTVFYPTKVIVSANIDAELIVQCDLGLGANVNKQYFVAYCKAGTPFIMDFHGDVAIRETGLIQIGINNNAATGNIWFSITGWERVANV